MDSTIIYRFFLILFIFTTSQVNAIEFQGNFTQGHFILGKTDPKAQIKVGKKEVKVSKDGFFVFGIDRDRKFDLTFTKTLNGKKSIITKKVLKREYNIQRIDGLAESKVTPPESVYKRIKKENNAIGEARALASPIALFSFLILLYTDSGGVTLLSASPSILCMLYSLFNTFLVIIDFFPFKVLVNVKSNFLSLSIPKTKKPSLDTFTSFLPTLICALGSVLPNMKCPWVKFP